MRQGMDMDTYFESAAGVTITVGRVRQELDAHGLNDEDTWCALVDELGDLDVYDAQDVLSFLGY